MDAIPSQDSLQDPGRSCPSTDPSCLFTLNLCIHNVVRPLVLRVLFGFPCKSLLSTVVSTLCPPHTWTTYIMTFPFRNNFLSPLLWFGWFLMGGGEYKETFIFLDSFVLFSSQCPQDSLPHVHLKFKLFKL